jgi:hypothetical protein
VIVSAYFDRLFRSISTQAEVVERIERARGPSAAVEMQCEPAPATFDGVRLELVDRVGRTPVALIERAPALIGRKPHQAAGLPTPIFSIPLARASSDWSCMVRVPDPDVDAWDEASGAISLFPRRYYWDEAGHLQRGSDK